MPGNEEALARIIEDAKHCLIEAGISEHDPGVLETVRMLATLAHRVGKISAQASIDWTQLPKGWLTPEEDALVPPRQLWLGPQDPISHYYRWVWEYLAYLQLLCELRRESSILELGCSFGRTSQGLLHYLRPPGFYRGLDVDRVRIQEGQSRIQAGHPNFQYLWSDIYNRHYNPEGRIRAESYAFPFAHETFDVIYAASLFTHLLPAEVGNYFLQSWRVLKPQGTCLFSFFLLDYYRGPGTTISPVYEFEHPLPGHYGVAVRDPLRPDDLIGYSIQQVEALAKHAGLRLLRVIPGLWSNNSGWAVHEQDLVLLGRDDTRSGSLAGADYETGWAAYSNLWESSCYGPDIQYLGDERWGPELTAEIIEQYVKPYLPTWDGDYVMSPAWLSRPKTGGLFEPS